MYYPPFNINKLTKLIIKKKAYHDDKLLKYCYTAITS